MSVITTDYKGVATHQNVLLQELVGCHPIRYHSNVVLNPNELATLAGRIADIFDAVISLQNTTDAIHPDNNHDIQKIVGTLRLDHRFTSDPENTLIDRILGAIFTTPSPWSWSNCTVAEWNRFTRRVIADRTFMPLPPQQPSRTNLSVYPSAPFTLEERVARLEELQAADYEPMSVVESQLPDDPVLDPNRLTEYDNVGDAIDEDEGFLTTEPPSEQTSTLQHRLVSHSQSVVLPTPHQPN